MGATFKCFFHRKAIKMKRKKDENVLIFFLRSRFNIGREICTSSAKSCLHRHARRLLLFSNGPRGFAVDLVASAGTPTAIAGNVHSLQPTLSTPPEVLARSRIVHFRRPSHPQTQRRQSKLLFSQFLILFKFINSILTQDFGKNPFMRRFVHDYIRVLYAHNDGPQAVRDFVRKCVTRNFVFHSNYESLLI
jgi:hypothetical protein